MTQAKPAAAAAQSATTSKNQPKPAASAAVLPATSAKPRGSELRWYALALGLGVVSGFIEVWFGDLMLTAIAAMFFCMLMGALRPARPWRWVLVVCGCIPLARLIAADVIHIYTERAQIYEAFAAFITGNAGAYVGSLGRQRVDDLWSTLRAQKQ